jgi:hypothetical protein
LNVLGSASMLANDSPNPATRVQVKVPLDNGRSAGRCRDPDL